MPDSDAPTLRQLFREELRRRWAARSVWRAILAVLGVLALQAAFTYITFPEAGSTWMNTPAAQGLPVVGTLGLFSPGFALLFQRRVGSPLTAGIMLMTVGWGIPALIVRYVVPAYAACSIAPSRKHRQVRDLLRAGVAPLTILLARGAASALPPVVAGVAAMGLATLLYGQFQPESFRPPEYVVVPTAAVVSPFDSSGISPYTPRGITAPLLTLFALAHWLLQAAAMVSISALCRRTWTAVTACYLYPLLVLPLASEIVGVVVLLRLSVAHSRGAWLEGQIGMLAFDAVAAGLLMLAAMAAIRSDAPAPAKATSECAPDDRGTR